MFHSRWYAKVYPFQMHTVVTDIYIRSHNISRVFTIHERNVNRGDESICTYVHAIK